MPAAAFYHLTVTSLERALPKLLEKSVEKGERCLVMTESPEHAEHLSALLWTYDPDSFLPHGTETETWPEAQPVLLSHSGGNRNGARFAFVTDGRIAGADAGFTRVFDLFDGTQEPSAQAARQRWKRYRDAGWELAYFKQNEKGGWEQGIIPPRAILDLLQK